MSMYAQLQIAYAMFQDWCKTTFGQGIEFPPVIGMPEVEKVWVK